MILLLTRPMQRARAPAQILQVLNHSAGPMLDANILKAPTMLCSLQLLLISHSYVIFFIRVPVSFSEASLMSKLQASRSKRRQ